MNYKYLQDPSHGWVEVPVAELRRLKIADAISPYSYRNGHFAYLEEDCDFSLWLEAKKDAGEDFHLVEHHTNNDSIVRSFRGYA